MRTAGVRELKPDKQQHDDMRRGRDYRWWVFLRILEHACLRADVRENMCWSFWRVKKNDPVLDMEWDKLMLACEGSCQRKKTLKRYFFFFFPSFCQQKRSDCINSWCQTRTMERKSQLKTIKVKLFSVSLISLSRSCFRVLDGSDDEELVNPTQWRKDVLDVGVASVTPQLLWGLAGDWVIVCCTLPPVTSSVCLSGTSDAAGGYNQIRLVEEVDWILSAQLWPADRYNGMIFVTKEGYNGLQPPPLPFKVLAPFLMDYLVLHLHRLHSLSSVPFSFYKCVFYCFLLYTIFLWSFLCISVLLWFGFCLFVFEVTSSVSPSWVWALFQSLVLIWRGLFLSGVYC